LLTQFGIDGSKQIVSVQSSPVQDDMFISILTNDNTLFIYELVLERRFQYQRDKYSEVINQENKTSHVEREDRGEESHAQA